MKNVALTCFLAAAAVIAVGCYSDVRRGSATGTTIAAMGIDADEAGMQDAMFIREALSHGAEEIDLGQMGVNRADDVHVKALAQRILDDHSRANKELMIIAREEGITIPLPSAEEDTVNNLQNLTGPDFDRSFLRHVIEQHRDNIRKFRTAARDARNTEVQEFASRTLPALEEHLRMAENINRVTSVATDVNEPAGAEPGGVERDPFYDVNTVPHQFNQGFPP